MLGAVWPVLGRWEAESATEEGLEMWAWTSLPAATVHQAQLLKSFCRVADLSLDGRGQRRRDGEVQPPGLCRPFKKLRSEGQVEAEVANQRKVGSSWQ